MAPVSNCDSVASELTVIPVSPKPLIIPILLSKCSCLYLSVTLICYKHQTNKQHNVIVLCFALIGLSIYNNKYWSAVCNAGLSLFYHAKYCVCLVSVPFLQSMPLKARNFNLEKSECSYTMCVFQCQASFFCRLVRLSRTLWIL